MYLSMVPYTVTIIFILGQFKIWRFQLFQQSATSSFEPDVICSASCHTTPTLKLFRLHVFHQAGSPQPVYRLAPSWEIALSVFPKVLFVDEGTLSSIARVPCTRRQKIFCRLNNKNFRLEV